MIWQAFAGLLPGRRAPEPGPGPEEKAYPGSGVQFVGSPDWRTLHALTAGGPAPDADALDRALAFATSAYCYTAFLWRASRVAEPPLMVVREDEDGEEWLPDHRLATFLARPRPDIRPGELLLRTQLYRDTTGAALWALDRNGLGDIGLATPFSAEEFEVRRRPPLIYGQYVLHTPAGPVFRAPEEVVHFRDVNPASWTEPLSRLDVALSLLNLGHTVNRIIRNYLRRAMVPGGIVSPDKDWQPTPEEWEAWKATVKAWHAGPGNAGELLAVLGGTTFSRTASGMADLLPADVLNRVEATVASVAGVPPVVLGWQVGLENSPWSQMSEARRQTYEDTIEPLWRDIEGCLTLALLTREEMARGELIRFDTSRVRALAPDREREGRIVALLEGTWTLNERRVFTGQSPLPPEDPRGEVIGPAWSAPPATGAGDGGTEDEEEDEDEEQEPEKSRGRMERKARGPAAADLIWYGFDLSTKAGEDPWVRAIYAHLRGELKDILAAVRAAGGDLTEGAVMDKVLRVLAEHRPRLIAKAQPLIASTGATAVRRLAGRLGLSFTVLEPGLLSYAAEESAFLARVMGEQTGKAVAAAVQQGLVEGETIRQLIPRLEALPAFDRTRAKLVARTETTRAWNGAQRRSMTEYEKASGRTVTKAWLSARDERVRDEHAALDDGRYIPINAAFANGLTEPGEPNCRCTLLYAVSGEGGETE